jgi:hypothetical protein
MILTPEPTYVLSYGLPFQPFDGKQQKHVSCTLCHVERRHMLESAKPISGEGDDRSLARGCSPTAPWRVESTSVINWSSSSVVSGVKESEMRDTSYSSSPQPRMRRSTWPRPHRRLRRAGLRAIPVRPKATELVSTLLWRSAARRRLAFLIPTQVPRYLMKSALGTQAGRKEQGEATLPYLATTAACTFAADPSHHPPAHCGEKSATPRLLQRCGFPPHHLHGLCMPRVTCHISSSGYRDEWHAVARQLPPSDRRCITHN